MPSNRQKAKNTHPVEIVSQNISGPRQRQPLSAEGLPAPSTKGDSWQEDNCCINTPSMSELNETLEGLVLQAQRYPAKSKARKKVLTKLCNAIAHQANLTCKNTYNLSPDAYQDALHEALQNTWEAIFRNIDKYDPNYPSTTGSTSVLKWFHSLLKWRFVDACRKHLGIRGVRRGDERKDVQNLSLDALKYGEPSDGSQQSYLDELSENDSPLPSEELREYIETDPESIFREHHVTDRPEANFRAIATLRFAGYDWGEIAEYFGISIGTVTPFFSRSVKKFAPKFVEYLQK